MINAYRGTIFSAGSVYTMTSGHSRRKGQLVADWLKLIKASMTSGVHPTQQRSSFINIISLIFPFSFNEKNLYQIELLNNINISVDKLVCFPSNDN